MVSRINEFTHYTSNGRKIEGLYAYKQGSSTPCALALTTIVSDPNGKHFGIVSEFNVTNYLDRWEIKKLARHVEKRAEAKERGEHTGDTVLIDFMNDSAK